MATDPLLLRQAIVAALSGSGSSPSNSTAQRDAQQWLNEFSQRDESWEQCLAQLKDADPQVQYFAGSMLMSKVRTAWKTMPPGRQQQVYTEFLSMLDALVSGTLVLAPPALKQITTVVAGAAALSGPAGITAFLGQALGLTDAPSPATVSLCLTLLSGLAYETLARPHMFRDVVVKEATARMPQLLQLWAVAATQGGGPLGTLAAPVFDCMKHFLNAGVTLCVLVEHKRELLQSIIAGLGCRNQQAFEAAVELLVDLLGNSAPQREGRELDGTGADSPATAVDQPRLNEAVGLIVNGLLAEQAYFKVSVSEGEVEICRGFCRVALGVAEAALEMLAAGTAAAIAIVDMILECTQSENLSLAELAVEFWPLLATVPLTVRGPAFHAPVFQRVLERCLRASAFPTGFTDWRSSEVEDTEFYRFREQPCAEALCVCFQELQVQYVKYLQALLEHTCDGDADWETGEVVLFAIRVVSVPIKEFLRRTDPDDPSLMEAQAVIVTFLDKLFQFIASSAPLVTSHWAAVEAGVRTVAAYAAWLGHKTHLLDGVFMYCMKALSVPGAWEYAASAIRNLTAKSASRFASDKTLEMLVAAVEAGVAAGMPLEPNTTVMQAMARIAMCMPPAELPTVLEKLVALNMQRASTSAEPEVISDQLLVIAAAIQFCDVTVEDASLHPVVCLLRTAWPVFDGIASKYASHSSVAQGLCEVYQRAITSAGPALAASLVPLCNSVVGMFNSYGHAVCLEFLGVVAETYGRGATEDTIASLNSLFMSVATPILELMKRNEASAHADVCAALFQLAHRFVSFCPEALLAFPVIDDLLAATQVVVKLQEKDLMLSCLVFMRAFLSMTDAREAMWVILEPQVRDITTCVVAAMTDSAPLPTMDALIDVLLLLIATHPPMMRQVMGVLLSVPTLVAKSTALAEPAQAVILSACFDGALPEEAQRNLLLDFAFVCRGHKPQDSLARYTRT